MVCGDNCDMSLHDEWKKYPTGKVPKGTICPKCTRYNSRNMVCTALVVKEGRVLMVKRDGYPMRGWWALVGGYLDWDETVEACALRELKEEAGVDGKIVSLLGVYADPERDKDGRQNVGITYVVETEGEAKVGEEVIAVKWFDLDGLPDKIAFDHRTMIEDYKKRIKNNPVKLRHGASEL